MRQNEIQKILVPVDGSKNSLRGLKKAILLAKRFHAGITCIFVNAPRGIFNHQDERIYQIQKMTEGERFLEQAKKECEKDGIYCSKKIVKGDPGADILQYAELHGRFDLIVVGARGRSRLGELFLGSVSNYIAHKSDIPVLIVK